MWYRLPVGQEYATEERATFRPTHRGTIATLLNTSIYDISQVSERGFWKFYIDILVRSC